MLDISICIITVIIKVRAQQLFTMFDWRIYTLVKRERKPTRYNNLSLHNLLTMHGHRNLKISTLVHRGRHRISNRWQHKVSNTFSFGNAAHCNVQPEIRQGSLCKVELKFRLLLAQEVFVLRTEQTTRAHYNWLELLFVCLCTDYAPLFIAVQGISGTINKLHYILDLIVAWSCIL